MGVEQNLQLSTGYLQGLSVLTDAYTRHTHAYQAYRGVVLGAIYTGTNRLGAVGSGVR